MAIISHACILTFEGTSLTETSSQTFLNQLYNQVSSLNSTFLMSILHTGRAPLVKLVMRSVSV